MHSEMLRIESMSEEVISSKTQGEQGVIVIVGDCNTINSRGVTQVNGDTLGAIAASLQNLTPEAVEKLLGPISEVLRAAAVAITKAEL